MRYSSAIRPDVVAISFVGGGQLGRTEHRFTVPLAECPARMYLTIRKRGMCRGAGGFGCVSPHFVPITSELRRHHVLQSTTHTIRNDS